MCSTTCGLTSFCSSAHPTTLTGKLAAYAAKIRLEAYKPFSKTEIEAYVYCAYMALLLWMCMQVVVARITRSSASLYPIRMAPYSHHLRRLKQDYPTDIDHPQRERFTANAVS